MADGSFIRIYYEDLMENHPAVWFDRDALFTFNHLLARADKMWPTPAELPRKLSRVGLEKCVGTGLVFLLKNHEYEVKGLNAMRQARQKQTQPARDRLADARSVTDLSNSHGSTDSVVPHGRARGRSGLPGNGSSSLVVEGVQGETTADDVGRLQRLADELTQQPYAMPHVAGGLGLKVLTEQLEPHGLERVEFVWRQIAARLGGRPTLRQLVLGADNVLNKVPDGRELAAAEREAEEELARQRRDAAAAARIAELRRPVTEPSPEALEKFREAGRKLGADRTAKGAA